MMIKLDLINDMRPLELPIEKKKTVLSASPFIFLYLFLVQHFLLFPTHYFCLIILFYLPYRKRTGTLYIVNS